MPTPEIHATERCRVVAKMYGDTKVCFHVTVLPEDVKIHAITVAGRDIFNIIDPEIRRAAYEEFKHRFINHST